jgi:hypothetical protein
MQQSHRRARLEDSLVHDSTRRLRSVITSDNDKVVHDPEKYRRVKSRDFSGRKICRRQVSLNKACQKQDRNNRICEETAKTAQVERLQETT